VRVILHVDMDAFFAAVEERDDPALRGRPIVVGADPRGGAGRGVACTANYAARRYGIHSAMPISQAWRACPHAAFVRPDFARYQAASHAVMDVLARYADALEIAGLDEAYLDVTRACGGDWGRVASLSRSLQAAVRRATGLSCSVGAAATKSVAKIASDRHKPHGLTVVPPDATRAFLAPLSVTKINGCGPKTAAALAALDLRTIGAVAATDPAALEARFGRHGTWLWRIATGADPRPVCPERGARKSRGNERTFLHDENDAQEVMRRALDLLDGLLDTRDDRPFTTITVKLRTADFATCTRAHTSGALAPGGAMTKEFAAGVVRSLLAPLLDGRAVRLVGVRLSGFRGGSGHSCAERGTTAARRDAAFTRTSRGRTARRSRRTTRWRSPLGRAARPPGSAPGSRPRAWSGRRPRRRAQATSTRCRRRSRRRHRSRGTGTRRVPPSAGNP
jgi:nucleotidyltransferase/DNA polymerase involved in DNA repair